MKWFVLFTQPRWEFKIYKDLLELGIEAYCPIYTTLKQYSDRKKKVKKPLLPSYVLVKIADQDRHRVFGVKGIKRYVFWLGKPATVREEEIKILKNHTKGVYQNCSFSHLKKGDTLEIPDGPLRGNRGNIITVDKNKIRLELPSLDVLVTLTQITV